LNSSSFDLYTDIYLLLLATCFDLYTGHLQAFMDSPKGRPEDELYKGRNM